MCKNVAIHFLDLYGVLPKNKLYNKMTGEIMEESNAEIRMRGEINQGMIGCVNEDKLTGESMEQNRIECNDEIRMRAAVNKVVNADGGVKCDGGKLDWTLLPIESLEEVVKILEFGAGKYGRENWKKVEVERYEKALLRHITAYWSGQKNDPETNLSHLSHAICNCLFILYLQKN